MVLKVFLCNLLSESPCLWFGLQTATELVEQCRTGGDPSAMTWYTPANIRGSISAPKPLCPLLDCSAHCACIVHSKLSDSDTACSLGHNACKVRTAYACSLVAHIDRIILVQGRNGQDLLVTCQLGKIDVLMSILVNKTCIMPRNSVYGRSLCFEKWCFMHAGARLR